VTTDGGTQDVAPDTDVATPKSDAVVPSAQSANSNVPEPNPGSDSRKRKKVERPETVAALFQYAYGEAAAGRKLNLARDLSNLNAGPDSLQEERGLVRRLAAEDPFLGMPPNLLADVADLQIKRPVRQRVLELVLVALATHKLFEGRVERLMDPRVEPGLTAREISYAARTFTFDALGQEEALERRAAKRERLRVNAVTAFELFRVLRDGWTTEQFIEDMCALVWDVPSQPAPRGVALLATAKSATDALSELSRHFEIRLRQEKRETSDVLELAAAQERRAEMAEERVRSLSASLESEKSRVDELQAEAARLAQLLETEQSRRFVDKSHAADDYEILRTQVIRQLSAQVNLLTDGLHALRNGSTAVAEEFVDRALGKIDAEVKRLKELGGGSE
jgi:hypothetical protein